MRARIIGSIFIILGTCIGAGMLALPAATAHTSYWMAVFMMSCAWLAMSLGAFALLEVNLWLPAHSNLISMSSATLGQWGKRATWLAYLLLFYSLLCAYLSGDSDILKALFASIHIDLPRWSTTLISLLVLGTLVYRGISTVDLVNRALMSIKFITYLALVLAIAPHIQLHYLTDGDHLWRGTTLMIMITSFGFAAIVPSLRAYLNSDTRALKQVLLIGSFLPFIIYLIWIATIQGLIPRSGPAGLIQIANSPDTNSLLMAHVSALLNNATLAMIAKLFISICAVTSFLGVSVGLVDFIADGFKLKKRGQQGLLTYSITYLPPLTIVLLAPGIFISALNYAGIICVVLLFLLPLLMLYSGRYRQKLTGERFAPGGKLVIVAGLFFGAGVLIEQIILKMYQYHWF